MTAGKIMTRRKWIVLVYSLLVIILILPFAVTIIHSVVAVDDFGMALKTYGIKESWEGAERYYYNWSGGFPFIFLEYLLNPLHFAPSYDSLVGIFLLLTFLLFVIVSGLYIKNVFQIIFGVDHWNRIGLCYLVFLAAMMNSGVYSEIYYWFVGNSYLWGLVLIMLHMIAAIHYFDKDQSILKCVGLSILGFISCFSAQNAVWAGLLYLLMWYLKIHKKRQQTNLYHIIPLIMMIIGGCISIFAPGNYVRHELIDSTGIHVFDALVYALKNSVRCVRNLVFNPVCLVCMMVLFVLGVKHGLKSKPVNPIILWLGGLAAIYCVIFPLALGYSNDGIPNRQYFVINMPMIIIGGCCLYYTGAYYSKKITEKKIIRNSLAGVGLALVIGVLVFTRPDFGQIPWVKTMSSYHDVVRESQFYKGLLREVETSKEETVIIERKRDEIPSPTDIIKIPYDVWNEDNWINGNFKAWFEKDKIVINIL